MNKNMKKRRFKNGCLWLAITLLAILFLLPTILTVVNSFLSAAEIERSYGAVLGGDTYMKEQVILRLVPDIATGEQYHTFLLQSPEYLQKFWNSVLYTVPITILQVAVSALAAYGFCRRPSRLRRLIFFGYLVLTLMPYQVTLVPNYLVSKQLGTYDTIWAILLPGIFSPFAVFLLVQQMRTIPNDYLDAASIDGASTFTVYRKVALPLCAPTLATLSITTFMESWNDYLWPLLMLTDKSKMTLPIALSTLNGAYATEYNVLMAGSLISMVPIILIYIFAQKYFENGMMAGGIKG